MAFVYGDLHSLSFVRIVNVGAEVGPAENDAIRKGIRPRGQGTDQIPAAWGKEKGIYGVLSTQTAMRSVNTKYIWCGERY